MPLLTSLLSTLITNICRSAKGFIAKHTLMGSIKQHWPEHYSYVIMDTMASQITSHTIVYSSVYSGADQRKHQSSASLAVVRGIHRSPVNSPHKGPVTRKIFPFDNVIMGVFEKVYVKLSRKIQNRGNFATCSSLTACARIHSRMEGIAFNKKSIWIL